MNADGRGYGVSSYGWERGSPTRSRIASRLPFEISGPLEMRVRCGSPSRGPCGRAELRLGLNREAVQQRRPTNYPEGIASFSPALPDNGGLRWVKNPQTITTLKVVVAAFCDRRMREADGHRPPLQVNGDATRVGVEFSLECEPRVVPRQSGRGPTAGLND